MPRREHRTVVDGVDFGSIFQFQSIFGAIDMAANTKNQPVQNAGVFVAT